MIGINYFSSIPTTLELNGPILSFSGPNTLQPISTFVCNGGSVTLTGFATATFPTQSPANPAQNSGSISYRWYQVGVGALNDSTNITGTGTTVLNLTNLSSPNDSEKQYFLRADYVPSAYAIGKSTGNAINETLDSNIVTVNVKPSITITNQPADAEIGATQSQQFEVSASVSDSTQSSLAYRWSLNGSDLSDTSTVIGSGTTTLSISLPTVGVNTVQARITHPSSCDSPVLSRVATFNVVPARDVINFENISGPNPANLFSWNLTDQGQYEINATTNRSILSFYAPEKDINVIFEIYGAKGLDSGSFVGGQGGISIIQLTMRKNEEYLITSIPQANQSGGVFVYRKSRLIACVGSGGNAGANGNGGFGGGINVAGSSGSGPGAGAGGILYTAGTLPSSGIFGSTSRESPTPLDSKADAPLGGRVLPCPRGGYWYVSGYSACQDLGNIQFYLADGTIVPNTAVISRGFKAGYGIRQTAGLGINGGGNGGGGATGGNGGNGGGGGGASGYTDGSVTVISTQQGGNNGNPKVIIKSV